jgi:hypothetical protein
LMLLDRPPSIFCSCVHARQPFQMKASPINTTSQHVNLIHPSLFVQGTR